MCETCVRKGFTVVDKTGYVCTNPPCVKRGTTQGYTLFDGKDIRNWKTRGGKLWCSACKAMPQKKGSKRNRPGDDNNQREITPKKK